ncbi:MAG: hypothetical protein HYU66_20135 [Armatimonadetes bacterium]|nr:hypothetical protein [Armatimonadota bacterium]
MQTVRLLALAVLASLLLCGGCGGGKGVPTTSPVVQTTDLVSPPPAGSLDLLGPLADWRAQDYTNSQGIEAVQREAARRVLWLTCRLTGGDAHRTNGEATLDLSYVDGLGGRVPLDLHGTGLTVKVLVPAGLVGENSRPNGLQVFLKDAAWASLYSAWINVSGAGTYELRLELPASRQGGFDPSAVRVVGVKVGIGTGSRAGFQGSVAVTDVRFSPDLALNPSPALPAASPRRPLVGRTVTVQSDGFHMDGSRIAVMGGNLRGVEYGQNFGTTLWFPNGNGFSQHRGYLEEQLRLFSRAGVEVVRVGVADDGRALCDATGHVTGYNERFRDDLRTLLDTAAETGVAVELCLLDYQIAGAGATVENVLVRGRGSVFTEPALRQGLIDDFVRPLLTEFGSHPALFAVEPTNEIEWVVATAEGGGWEDVTSPERAPAPVPLADWRAWVQAVVRATHELAPGKLVTEGVSAKFAPLLQGLGLDFAGLHYYPWMGDLAPLVQQLPAGLPWVMAEYPTDRGVPDVRAYRPMAAGLGAAGDLLWNLTPGIDNRTMTWAQRNAVLEELAGSASRR